LRVTGTHPREIMPSKIKVSIRASMSCEKHTEGVVGAANRGGRAKNNILSIEES